MSNLKKLAFDPVTFAAAAATGHVTKNALIKAVDAVDSKGRPPTAKERRSRLRMLKHKVGDSVHKGKAKNFSKGVHHGMNRKRHGKSIPRQLAENTPLVGTEAINHQYNKGYDLGRKIRHLPPKAQDKKLREYRDSLKNLPQHYRFPGASASARGANIAVKSEKTKQIQDKNKKHLEDLASGKKSIKWEKRRKAARGYLDKGLKGATVLSEGDRLFKGIGKATGVGDGRAVKRFVAKEGIKRLNPNYKESKKAKAARLASDILISPDISKYHDATGAVRDSIKRNKTGKTVEKIYGAYKGTR